MRDFPARFVFSFFSWAHVLKPNNFGELRVTIRKNAGLEPNKLLLKNNKHFNEKTGIF